MSKINVSDEFHTQVADHEKELTQLLFNRVLKRFDSCISVKRKCWQQEDIFDFHRLSSYLEDIQNAFKPAEDDCAAILRFSFDDVEDMYIYTLYEMNNVRVQAIQDLVLHYNSLVLPF